MSKFKAGDVVVLNSGGPQMTVESYSTNDPQKLTCTWFDKNNERKSEHFQEAALKKYELGL